METYGAGGCHVAFAALVLELAGTICIQRVDSLDHLCHEAKLHPLCHRLHYWDKVNRQASISRGKRKLLNVAIN